MIEAIDIKKYFYSGLFRKTCIRAVDGVSFHLGQGEALGVIGESGSGKSTLGRCVIRLLEPSGGEVYFHGKRLSDLNGGLRYLRQKMQIIFQDTGSALNPRMKALDLLLEPLKVHKRLNGQRREAAMALMEKVDLPADLLDRYPNELSGGQRQRLTIARAISLNPEFLVVDEAVASLDLLGQKQIMELFNKLKSEQKTSFFIISHSLRFVRRTTDKLAVMYRGKFVEIGKTEEVFEHPKHYYTQKLLSKDK